MVEAVRRQDGFALLTTLVLMILMAAVAALALTTARDERRVGQAVRGSAKAFYAAEAGMEAVIAGWDSGGYGSLQSGDSSVVGWQTLENRARYRAVVRRVDAGGGDTLYSIRVVGHGPGNDASRRKLGLLVRAAQATGGLPYGIAANGWMEIGGSTELVGSCADSHVNGDYKAGNLTTSGSVSATGIIDGEPQSTEGGPAPTEEGAPSEDIPSYAPLDHCAAADYKLRSGYVIDVAAGDSVPADGTSTAQDWNWKPGDQLYELMQPTASAGTWCAWGNVKLAGGIGSTASPKSFSMFADGSIEAGGNSILAADHADGWVLMADGDVMFSGGTATGYSVPNIEGHVYARSQCELKGSSILVGQLVCRNDSDPAGTLNLSMKNKLGGGTKIKYECSGGGAGGGTSVSRIAHGWREIID